MGTTYNHYQGNSGRVERRQEPASARPAPPPPPGEQGPPSPLSGLSGGVQKLFDRLSGLRLETEDLLLLAILYLLYRDSGDEEFLIALAGLLLF